MKTPQQTYPSLNEALGVELYLKREDLHKYKSHKGRSIPLMIKKYAKEGIVGFVISSSGNAAIAAAIAAENHNRNNPLHPITLHICVGKHIDPQKMKHLTAEMQSEHITIEQYERPKQKAFQMDKQGTAKFLRQSTDDSALEGYASLADDVSKIPDVQAVFVPTSSGTTAQALGTTFLEKTLSIQIHIVQTTQCHPIAEVFDTSTDNTPSSAGAIVDKVAHRKDAVVDVIQKTKGSGWIASNDEIEQARKLIQRHAHIDISPNSALSVAGLSKAIKNGWKWDGPVVCIITGP